MHQDMSKSLRKFVVIIVKASLHRHQPTNDLRYFPFKCRAHIFYQRCFRDWLRGRYGSLEQLGGAWFRYSYADSENVHPPRSFGGYPESLDWLEFRIDDAFRLADLDGAVGQPSVDHAAGGGERFMPV